MYEFPRFLEEAIASEPTWLLLWLAVLAGSHTISILFVVYKHDDGWGFRWEPLAIIGSLLIADMIMQSMFHEYGYVRLLGLAHLIGWAPIYAWMVYQRKIIGFASLWGKYVHWYLVIAGISLFIDGVDVIRYLVGDDGNLYLRWSSRNRNQFLEWIIDSSYVSLRSITDYKNYFMLFGLTGVIALLLKLLSIIVNIWEGFKRGYTMKECPYCKSEIKDDASKCPHCAEWISDKK
jgi:hypothetical protein|tara:strand:- start:772 stop:1473 length:702 start_codon:yes stop_codon:yes gene_type:complete